MRSLLGAITLDDIAAIAKGEAPWPDAKPDDALLDSGS